ncbi:MAG: hypothetical protein LBT38_02640 [Deltaproteobacteria bacterium]|jgi:hypothetical protein|nr:hypothetical protein [Deltaproteobacteria bacterium]
MRLKTFLSIFNFRVWALIILLAVSSACAVKPIVEIPQPLELNLTPIKKVLETGDFLVIRGLTGADNFIATMTNMPFSHAAIYDQERDEVIESDGSGVHRTPFAKFLGKASRVWVVKPIWATPERRVKAVARARARVGRPYDFLGLIGLSIPDSYYCSELVIDAWRPFIDGLGHNPIPLVISPGRLHHWGRVAYDSLEIGLEGNQKTENPPSDQKKRPE